MYSLGKAAAGFVTSHVWGDTSTSPKDRSARDTHTSSSEMRQVVTVVSDSRDSRYRSEQDDRRPPTRGASRPRPTGEREPSRRRSKSRAALNREPPSPGGGRPRTPRDDYPDAGDSGGGGGINARETRLADERTQLRTQVAHLETEVQQRTELLNTYHTANTQLDQRCAGLKAANAQLDQRCRDLEAAQTKSYHSEQLTTQELARAHQDLARRQGEVAQLRPLVNEVEKLKIDITRLRRAEEALGTLQKEVLAGVDRHEPAFDEAVLKEFIGVNGKISALIKYQGAFFKKAAAVSFEGWGEGAIWKGAYNVEIEAVKARDKRVVKQLLRLVVWRFLGRRLLDRERPFRCFGSNLAKNLDEDYHLMFKGVELSEAAAKWRAMTAARLLELDDEPCRTSTQDYLIREFARVMHEYMGHTATPIEELEEWLRSSVLKQLGAVLKSAVSLAQLVAKERSGFSLEMPDLASVRFTKSYNDPQMTTRGAPLNIDVGGANEEEGGVVVLVASPLLIKWGTSGGHGEEASSRDVLAKAFVEVVPGSMPAGN